MKLSSLSRFITTEVILFFALWVAYGLAINSSNQLEFGIQQGGVEAIVDRHHFYVEGSWLWPARGDCFHYQGHTYSNKQPGQPMAGAVVYFFLRLIGLSYAKNQVLVAGLVTFFTASLLTAAAGAVVFRLARELDDRAPQVWPVGIALVYGLGTIAFTYSGIAHHDAMASAFLIIAFYLIFTLPTGRSPDRRKQWRAMLAGSFLGLTITTSMVPVYMTVLAALYFLSLRQWKLVPSLVLGGLLGIAPLLIYDAINFGNPFVVPVVAAYRFEGHDPEAFLRLDWNNFIDKVNYYTEAITLYIPVFWLGLVGIFLLRKKYQLEKYFMLGMIAVLFGYLLNIGITGWCSYGPRYLLPAMPFASVGLIGLRQLSLKKWKRVATVGLVIVCLFSIAVNLVGAVQGAMYCERVKYGFTEYLLAIMRGDVRSYPLVRWLLPFAVVFSLLLVFLVRFTDQRKRQQA